MISFENTCEDLDLCQQPSWFDQDPQNSVKCARSCMKQWTCGKGSTAAGLWRSSAGCAERASIHPSCRSPSALLHVAAQDPCLTHVFFGSCSLILRGDCGDLRFVPLYEFQSGKCQKNMVHHQT